MFVRAWTAKVRRLPRRLVVAGLLTRVQEPAAAELVAEILTEIATWKTQADLKRALVE